MTILDNEFNHTEYSLSKDTNITPEEMFVKDIASWPKEARIWLKPGIQKICCGEIYGWGTESSIPRCTKLNRSTNRGILGFVSNTLD